MLQDPNQAEKKDDKASTGGMSSLDFNFLGDFENGTDTLEGTTEPAEEGTSTLEPPSAFMEMLPEEEWEVHHRDHENRTGCKMDIVAFMEEVWTAV